MFYAFLAIAVGGLIGGWIGSINLRWAWYIMIPTFALLIPIALSLREPQRHKKTIKKGYALELLKTLKNIFTNNLKLRWIIIYSAFILTFNQAAVWLYQPYMKITGLDIMYFGIAYAFFNTISAISSKYSDFFTKIIGAKKLLILFPLFIAISYFLMGNITIVAGFVFVFFQRVVCGMKGPIITNYINNLVSSDIRATVLSVESFIGRLGYAAVIPIVGWIADVYSVQQAFNVLGITTLLSSGVLVIVLSKQGLLKISK